jgi:anti-sigma factor RsiW
MTCDRSPQLHAYHDGQLSSADAAAMEAHLLSCLACSAELAELRGISAMFAQAQRPRLSQIERHRLHRNLDAVMERGLVRFAWSLSGVAAAVLLVGSFWLSQATEPVQAAPPWVDAVVYAHPLGDRAETPAAQWYLADATPRNTDDAP